MLARRYGHLLHASSTQRRGVVGAVRHGHRTHAQAADVEPSVSQEKFYVQKAVPQPYWGPIRLEQLPGKGRGLLATRDLEPGTLLMVCPPLELVTGAEDEVPEGEELMEQIMQREFQAEEAQMLLQLYDGSEADQAARQLAASETIAAHGGTLKGSDLDLERLYKIIVLNCFGEDASDLPAAICRGDKLVSHVGLWPQFSMLNHSCSPNAVNLVIGGQMVVRAASHVAEGEELAINYLGRGSLLAYGERQLQLEEGYGFTCLCRRCSTEAGALEDVVQTASEVWRMVERDLRPDLEAAFQTANRKLQQEVIGELRILAEGLQQQAEEVGCSSQEAAWVQAGAYECYSVLALAAEAEEDWDPRPSLKCCQIIDAVAPGSDLHILLSVRHLSLVQKRFGAQGAEARHSLGECRRVFALRYGNVDKRVLEKLIASAASAVERVIL